MLYNRNAVNAAGSDEALVPVLPDYTVLRKQP